MQAPSSLALAAPAVALAVALLVGCASSGGVTDPKAGRSTPARDCLAFLDELDRAVRVAGVGDAASWRVPDFPYLRADRFTASLGRDPVKAALGGDAGAAVSGQTWVERMRELDREGRRVETTNLPASNYPLLGSADADAAQARVRTCGDILVREDSNQPARHARLVESIEVPDDYSTAQRAFGLYSLTGIGMAAGVRRWQDDARASFERQRDTSDRERVVYQRYSIGTARDNGVAGAGAGAGASDSAAAIALARRLLANATRDPLGVPQIEAADLDALFTAFAPSFEIATSAEHDRFGPLQWIDLRGLVWPGADRYWLDVDPSQPVVYRQPALTRFEGNVLVQLVYTIWFPERPSVAGDLEAGRLDGLQWRVTLDTDGEPLLFDTIHPCGCYHLFFPSARLRARPPPQGREIEEWAFSPIDRPIEDWVRQRDRALPVGPVSLRLSTHSHQLIGIGLAGERRGEPFAENPPYRLVDADRLRTLALPGGGSRSVYGPDGIVPGTERLERFFLWPSGIASPGAMRQYGRQPTAFIGRRHFDDANLLDSRFERR